MMYLRDVKDFMLPKRLKRATPSCPQGVLYLLAYRYNFTIRLYIVIFCNLHET